MTAEATTNVRSIQGEALYGAASIPSFESEEVTATKGKITSVAGLEVGDQSFRMDETVRLVVECRVVGIDHKVSPAGKLERVHTLKAIDSVVVDWQLDLEALRDGTK